LFVHRFTESPPGYEVGYFRPDGDFTVVSKETTLDAARHEVHFLNGGQHPTIVGALKDIVSQVANIAAVMRRSELNE
jgi:hypothetical protein